MYEVQCVRGSQVTATATHITDESRARHVAEGYVDHGATEARVYHDGDLVLTIAGDPEVESRETADEIRASLRADDTAAVDLLRMIFTDPAVLAAERPDLAQPDAALRTGMYL